MALVDRLVHNAEIVAIDGDSYRRKEAEERQKRRSAERNRRRGRPRDAAGVAMHRSRPRERRARAEILRACPLGAGAVELVIHALGCSPRAALDFLAEPARR